MAPHIQFLGSLMFELQLQFGIKAFVRSLFLYFFDTFCFCFRILFCILDMKTNTVLMLHPVISAAHVPNMPSHLQ